MVTVHGDESSGVDSNFDGDEETAALFKGRSIQGTFAGQAGDTIGVWTAYKRFDPVENSSANFLTRRNFVKAPGTERAVLVRILGPRLVATGKQPLSKHAISACYTALVVPGGSMQPCPTYSH